MDEFAITTFLNFGFLIIIIYLISRVAHFFSNTKAKIEEIDEKVDELKELMINKK